MLAVHAAVALAVVLHHICAYQCHSARLAWPGNNTYHSPASSFTVEVLALLVVCAWLQLNSRVENLLNLLLPKQRRSNCSLLFNAGWLGLHALHLISQELFELCRWCFVWFPGSITASSYAGLSTLALDEDIRGTSFGTSSGEAQLSEWQRYGTHHTHAVGTVCTAELEAVPGAACVNSVACCCLQWVCRYHPQPVGLCLACSVVDGGNRL